uniref:Ankyrin repeat domain-containing protein SOWAHC-like n=1 Tax=Sinocyclocheilus rhinocerous TaxID=307959 RepID=A0A673MAP1_9TELE
MATECNQEAVLHFIKERGGRVKTVDLTDHFRATIPKDPALKSVAKEALKRYVDSVSYVKEENGEKYVCLKKKCRKSTGSIEKSDRNSPADDQAMLPGSGDATAKAGGAQTQPGISVRFPERVNSRTESELMGNSSSSTAEDKPASKNRPHDTPKNSRKHLVRRSVYLSGRCKDGPRGDSDYEAAAVTLEPLEHEWMLCASDGDWDSLHRLLARDPSLLTRKDFVTGFTCLHWAAKLGKHELIVMLVNFAKAHQVAVNVNARSSAGYTPLHLAATHNHLEVVKLLVGAFDADVEARDYSGRKACQYLKSDIAQNILDIAGACVQSDADSVDAGDASRWRLSRVIQSNFRPLKTQNSSEEDGSGLIKQKSLRRKSSFTKMKPSLSKIRMRSQIVHSTSLLDRFEKDTTEESPNLLRPKSNLFG